VWLEKSLVLQLRLRLQKVLLSLYRKLLGGVHDVVHLQDEQCCQPSALVDHQVR
jgi:hypothetical protein